MQLKKDSNVHTFFKLQSLINVADATELILSLLQLSLKKSVIFLNFMWTFNGWSQRWKRHDEIIMEHRAAQLVAQTSHMITSYSFQVMGLPCQKLTGGISYLFYVFHTICCRFLVCRKLPLTYLWKERFIKVHSNNSPLLLQRLENQGEILFGNLTRLSHKD